MRCRSDQSIVNYQESSSDDDESDDEPFIVLPASNQTLPEDDVAQIEINGTWKMSYRWRQHNSPKTVLINWWRHHQGFSAFQSTLLTSVYQISTRKRNTLMTSMMIRT